MDKIVYPSEMICVNWLSNSYVNRLVKIDIEISVTYSKKYKYIPNINPKYVATFYIKTFILKLHLYISDQDLIIWDKNSEFWGKWICLILRSGYGLSHFLYYKIMS